MRLHQHFTINFLLIFVGTVLLAGVVSYLNIKSANIEHYKKDLSDQMKLIKLQLPHSKDLSKLAKDIKKETGTRVTLIDDDGVVFIESDYNPKNMDNHGERKEVRIARAENEGFAIRTSDTLKINFLYMASAFYLNNQPIYVRISFPLESINEQFFTLWSRIAIIFSFSIIIAMIITYRLSATIRKEIAKITATLEDISNKNYKSIVNASFATEFHEIEDYTKKLSTKLEKREKQKRKYTAKIKLISRQRSDIISAISHEFKNPIASVIGYAQTLLEDPNTNESIRKRFLEKIVKNSSKISHMIDRLSLATKFENGDLTPQMTKFDLCELCQEVLCGFEDKYKDRDFILECENYLVQADKTMIEMVVTNLIDNAIKYSEGKIVLQVKDQTLHVKDKGIGIEQKELEQITKKFYRSNTLSWDNSLGLGLALVSHILALHNSNLTIQSKIGEGSDFSFKI